VRIVIIGGSHAGISLAENLRRGGYKDKITIIEKQKNIPTEKPPLSKKFLESTFDEENIKLRNQTWFKDNLIEILFNINISEWGIYGDSIDISNDGIDNDGDGFIDSEDSDEFGAPRDAAKIIAINKVAEKISTKIISTW